MSITRRTFLVTSTLAAACRLPRSVAQPVSYDFGLAVSGAALLLRGTKKAVCAFPNDMGHEAVLAVPAALLPAKPTGGDWITVGTFHVRRLTGSTVCYGTTPAVAFGTAPVSDITRELPPTPGSLAGWSDLGWLVPFDLMRPAAALHADFDTKAPTRLHLAEGRIAAAWMRSQGREIWNLTWTTKDGKARRQTRSVPDTFVCRSANVTKASLTITTGGQIETLTIDTSGRHGVVLVTNWPGTPGNVGETHFHLVHDLLAPDTAAQAAMKYAQRSTRTVRPAPAPGWERTLLTTLDDYRDVLRRRSTMASLTESLRMTEPSGACPLAVYTYAQTDAMTC